MNMLGFFISLRITSKIQVSSQNRGNSIQKICAKLEKFPNYNPVLFLPNLIFSEITVKVFLTVSWERFTSCSQLNANIHYQIFCGVRINPLNPLSNFKIVSEIRCELGKKLQIDSSQQILADYWKPYLEQKNNITPLIKSKPEQNPPKLFGYSLEYTLPMR